jgi:hypothetical protein
MAESPLHRRGTPITFTRQQAQVIRTALRLGKPLPPCPHCGAVLATGDPIAGGGTVGPVWQVHCDECGRSAFLTELADGRQAADDASVARGLPDEVIALDTIPSYRVTQVVVRHWPQYAEEDRQRLVAILRPILEPLAEPGASASNAIREQCAETVLNWIKTTDLGSSNGNLGTKHE